MCRGLEFYDHSLLGAEDGAAMRTLALKHVVQSGVKIRAPLLHNTDLVFTSSKKMAANSDQDSGDETFLISIPLSEIDILGRASGSANTA